MLIKDLAERAGVTVKAVRYYESRGLLSPARAANRYRESTPATCSSFARSGRCSPWA